MIQTKNLTMEYQIQIEVTEVVQQTYIDHNIIITKQEPSKNGWTDITLKGTKPNLLNFLKEYMDEGIEYFNENIISPLYSIDCKYYEKTFNNIDLLVEDIVETGMDPNYEITKDDIGIGEEAIDYIVH